MTTTARPRRRTQVDKFEDLKFWSFLVSFENILLIIPFTFLWSGVLASALSSGSVGGFFIVARTALGLVLSVTLFFCYLLVLLDYTARGFQKPPKISGDLISSNKGRFIKVMVLMSFFVSAAHSLTGDYGGYVFGILSVFLLPMMLSIIAIEDRLLRALNPLVWFAFLNAIKWDKHLNRYIACYCLILAIGYTLISNDPNQFDEPLWFWLTTVALVGSLVTATLALFRVIGIMTHANADSLGLPVIYSKQTEADQQASLDQENESEFLADLYRLSQAGRTQQAFSQFKKHTHLMDSTTVNRLWRVVFDWSNASLALLVGQQLIELLAKEKDFATAWKVLELCYERNANRFVLSEAKTTLNLANLAENERQRQISLSLLKAFPKEFPNHPQTADALLKAVELCTLDSNSRTDAKQLLKQIQIRYPDLSNDKRYRTLNDFLNQPK